MRAALKAPRTRAPLDCKKRRRRAAFSDDGFCLQGQRGLARAPVSARRDLGRRRRQFRAVLRARARRSSCACSTPTAGARSSASRCAERTDLVWHCYLPEARPGTALRLPRARAYAPEQGHRFNPHKLLLDPYAQAIGRRSALERRAVRLSRRCAARGSVVRHARHRAAACRSAR